MKVLHRIARPCAIAFAIIGVAAISAAIAVGSGYIPPVSAIAAENQAVSAEADPSHPIDEKVDALAAYSPVASKAMVASPLMTLTPVKAKPTPKRRASRSVSRGAPSGWRTARVSWYGPGFYGNTMAGGGTLTPTSMVVAHRSLPFGTRVQFKYRGKSVTAVVQDRGPYVGGRTFDLGPGTAKALGFSGVGIVQYRILGR